MTQTNLIFDATKLTDTSGTARCLICNAELPKIRMVSHMGSLECLAVRSTFNAPESHTRKERGMDLSAAARRELLENVRWAVQMAAARRPEHTATADDAHFWLVYNGYHDGALGNSAGSLFRGGRWEFTGQWTKSNRVVAHRNDLRVWRLL